MLKVNRNKAYPQHIGIIPDGNRRWAKEADIPLESAYWKTMLKLYMCAEKLYENHADSVSIYLLSKDNITRPRNDLYAVIDAETRLFKELIPLLKKRFNLKAYHAGDLSLVPDKLSSAISSLCDLGNGHMDPFPKIYFCVAYDPYEEVINLCNNPKTDKNLISRLSVPLELDLIIRTGGEMRISGFLPLQSKYAEFFFEEYYFPEISEGNIIEIIEDFTERNRRYGK